MPIGFLTATERDRLNHFPTSISDEDLRAFFLLSEADQHIIYQQREPHTRLGFALQLCALRYLGFAPDDLRTTPGEMVLSVARQLDVPPAAIHAYGQRFPVAGKTRHARRMPPPLGYGMGVTFYTWSSDQLAQYGTKFVPVTVRDSTYVLDELCNNETELPIREHTTDTAGAVFILTLVEYTRIPDRGEQDRLRPASPDDTPAPLLCARRLPTRLP